MIGWFRRLLVKRKWLTFILMCVFFLMFGLSSLNIVYMFHANINLFLDNGIIMVIRDGGLQQLVELIGSGFLSMASYFLFKCCEYVLVHWVIDPITHPQESKH